MNIAQQYLQKQFSQPEFRQAFFEEKAKMDIEYQLEELKKAIQTHAPIDDLIRQIDSIEQFLQTV